MSHGYKAAWKSNQHRVFNGKRMEARWWFCRGKFTKTLTIRKERLIKKRVLKQELNNL